MAKIGTSEVHKTSGTSQVPISAEKSSFRPICPLRTLHKLILASDFMGVLCRRNDGRRERHALSVKKH